MNETNRQQGWVETTTLSAGVLIVLAIFAMANYLSMRHYQRFDATSSKLYTLSEKTENVLRDLDRDIDLVVLLNPASELYTAIDELLDRYVAANPARLERRDLDAARDLLELQQLIDRYGIERDNVIIVASEDDKRVIGEFELATYDYSGAQMGQPPAIDELKGEQQITSAILSLVEAEKPKLVFTTGHGEARLEPELGDARSLSQARDLLGKDNFDIEEWSSLGQDAVPEGTDLLVVAGPTTNFLEPELQLFSEYLESGGRMLLLLDPVFNADGTALVELGLADWLAGYGVELRQDLVIDPSSDLPFFGAETLFTDSYGNHPIVDSLEQTRTRVLLPLVRSVAASDAPPANVELTELVLTSEAGWAETDLVNLDQVAPDDGTDRLGPVPIAVAATIASATEANEAIEATDDGALAPSETGDVATGDIGGDVQSGDVQSGDVQSGDAPPASSESDDSRLVVFGDLDFASDAQLANGANGVLLLNAFNWLVEREQLIEIEARKPEKTRLTMAGGELTSLYLIVLLMMPGAAIITGVWIAMQRRR